MKKIIIALSAAGLMLFNSCGDDFLEKNPPLAVSESDVFTNSDRIESTVLGLYAQIKNTGDKSFMGGKSYVVFDAMGDDFVNISNNLVTLFGTYNMATGTNDAENADNWEQAYLAVNDANVFLEKLENSKSVAGDLYGQYKAEALFVRAFTYYYLNMLYGSPYTVNQNALSVPLRLTASTNSENNNLAQSTVKEVFEQILADLSSENIANLPDGDRTEAGTTRATKAAAHMLKMRVYMAMAEWDNAIAEGTAISGYGLATNIADAFLSPNSSNENIFSFPMSSTNKPNTQQTVWEYYYDGQILIVQKSAPGIMSITGYNNSNDARISKFTGLDPQKKNTIITKYNENETFSWIPVYRYSETLLNLAECYASNTSATDDNLAKSCLKQVRRRSLSNADDTNFSDTQIDALSGTSLKSAIYNERRLEFMGEGIRSLDIHRRGENYVKGELNVKPSDSNYIWPIPTTETAINKAI